MQNEVKTETADSVENTASTTVNESSNISQEDFIEGLYLGSDSLNARSLIENIAAVYEKRLSQLSDMSPEEQNVYENISYHIYLDISPGLFGFMACSNTSSCAKEFKFEVLRNAFASFK